jgi:hypothetical protein
MNFRGCFLLVAACLFGSALGGCALASAETGRNKTPTIVMDLAPNVAKAVATVRIGDEVKFMLPSDRGPAFVWQIVSNDPRCMRQSSGISYKAGATEAVGMSSVTFIAQRPSRSIIRFAYVPAASGKETEPVDAYEIFVTVRG